MILVVIRIFNFCSGKKYYRRGGTQNSQLSTEEDVDEPIDPNEPRYCICNQVAYGTMVACDNKGVNLKKMLKCYDIIFIN